MPVWLRLNLIKCITTMESITGWREQVPHNDVNTNLEMIWDSPQSCAALRMRKANAPFRMSHNSNPPAQNVS